VSIQMTGWTQATGATFNTTSGGKPQLLPLANASPGFVEALLAMRKGETALVWIPPALGYVHAPTSGTEETLVYKIELVDVMAAPPVPADVAAPPATALAAPSGMKYVVLKPATTPMAKREKIRAFDGVSFDFTGWDKDGRMVQTTETARRTQTSPVYKLPPAFAEVVEMMGVGERVRLWTTVARLGPNAKTLGPPETPLCFELVLSELKKGVEPPPPPPDVAAPPADAKLTARKVAYKVLVAAPSGAKLPGGTDHVKLHYTGWRAEDGRMFDSSVQRDEPVTVAVNAPLVPGWTEVLPLMGVGAKWRVWVPDELAYRGAPGRPQGMLVFELQVLEVLPPVPSSKPANVVKPVKRP
jgi:peptidylprolyl isomerase